MIDNVFLESEEKYNAKNIVVAEVVGFFDNGSPQIKFSGESDPARKEYPRLKNYVPAKNDRVLLLPVASSYVIIGALETNKTAG